MRIRHSSRNFRDRGVDWRCDDMSPVKRAALTTKSAIVRADSFGSAQSCAWRSLRVDSVQEHSPGDRTVRPVESGSGGIQWSTEGVALKPSRPDVIAARCCQDPGVAEKSKNVGLGELRPSGPAPKSRKRQDCHVRAANWVSKRCF